MWILSNKVLVEDSGLLEGFRDCHCHLLPGVDDGVGDLKETLQILQKWEKMGVKEVWMTPHVMEDIPNEPTMLKERFEKTKAQYQGTVELHLATENMMDGLFVRRLDTGDMMTIGKAQKRLLVETSYYIPPMNMDNLIDAIRMKGYEPILAHPERYQYMENRDYRHWKEKGVLLQLNVPSVAGAYGLEVQRKAEWLLKENMYDYCGTDTHSLEQMEYFMESEISKKTAKKLKQLSEAQEL